MRDDDGFGELTDDDGRAVIRFRRVYRYSPQKIWQALTEPAHLMAWFPTTVEGERATGATLQFAFRDMEGEDFTGHMLRYEPPRLMEMQWGDETLRFELTPRPEGCLLLFTVTFDEMGKAARDGAGWHSCLDLLAYAVADETAPWSAAERWGEVCGAYVTRFGPEASAIGPPEGWERVHGAEAPGP